MFKFFAYHFICTKEVGSGNSLTIWWIGYYDALVGGLCEVFKVGLLNSDVG